MDLLSIYCRLGYNIISSCYLVDDRLSTPTTLTAVVISFSTCCFWPPLMSLLRLINQFFSSSHFPAQVSSSYYMLACRFKSSYANPWINSGMLFKWRFLFSASTFINTCTFVNWNWADAQIAWISRGLWHQMIFTPESAPVFELVKW